MLYGLLFGGVSFTQEKDIPDQSEKVIFITGGTRGIGYQTALALAKKSPAHIYISARNQKTADKALADIKSEVPSAKVSFLPCDLADLESVQACAREFLGREKRLDLLFLNAGIMVAPAGKTKQGYEIQFGTNHIGHFLLTKLLLSTLEQTASLPGTDVRIVSVSSIAHYFAPCPGIVFSELKTEMSSWLSMRRYGQSKLANILFAKYLSKQLKDKDSKILAVSIHPGVVDTGLYEYMEKLPVLSLALKIARKMMIFLMNAKEGANTQLWAATAPRATEKDSKSCCSNSNGKVVNGEFYTPIGAAGQAGKLTFDEGLAKKLWEWTEEEVKDYTL